MEALTQKNMAILFKPDEVITNGSTLNLLIRYIEVWT